MTLTAPARVASDASIRYLRSLVTDRVSNPAKTLEESIISLEAWLAANPTQREVSTEIDRVKVLPYRAIRRPGAYPEVPESILTSKYVIATSLLANLPAAWAGQEELFLEISPAGRGRGGRRFLNRLSGAPGAFRRSRLPGALASEIYAYLDDQERAINAMNRFGEVYTCCGKCAAPLTDDLSRARGIGPVCWGQIQAWLSRR